MADIFLSYSSADRAYAERFERAFVAAGYTVFWDQATPPGEDWDAWIRRQLATSRLVLVLWSATSVASPNVRHEAMIARDAQKLVPALIAPLKPADFPMGLYLVQALDFSGWKGDADDPRFRRLLAEMAARLGRPLASAAGPSKTIETRGVRLGSMEIPPVRVEIGGQAGSTPVSPSPPSRRFWAILTGVAALVLIGGLSAALLWMLQTAPPHEAAAARAPDAAPVRSVSPAFVAALRLQGRWRVGEVTCLDLRLASGPAGEQIIWGGEPTLTERLIRAEDDAIISENSDGDRMLYRRTEAGLEVRPQAGGAATIMPACP